MRRYQGKALLAHLRQSASLHVLAVLGVALGVASVLSVQLVTRSAIGTFAAGVRAVSGDADLAVTGRTSTLPEALYPEVLAVEGVLAARPLHRVHVALEGPDPGYLDILGVDLVAPGRLAWRDGQGGAGASRARGLPADPATAALPARLIGAALVEPGWVAVSPDLAARRGWSVGDAITVTSGSRRARLRIGAMVDLRESSPAASSRIAVMDLGEVQSLLGEPGRLHQIDVRVADGSSAADVARRLAARLGPDVQVTTPEQREIRGAELSSAFRLNLTALSLVSLLVGLFLVHQSVRASLVRRRTELGLLRVLGATRGQVTWLGVGEIGLLGVAGVLVGLPLGYVAASVNLRVAGRTLTNLYLLAEIERLEVSAGTLALAALIGLGGALLGGLLPVLDLARRDPKALLATLSLYERVDRLAVPLAVAGASLLALVFSWWWLGGAAARPGGFVLAFAVLTALPLLTPLAVRECCRHVRVRGFGPGYGIRSVSADLHATAPAVASLAMAVSMLVGITLMVESFRRTVEEWVTATVRADLYVTTESWARAGGEAGLEASLVAAIAGQPEVATVDRLRRLVVEADGRRITVLGIDMGLPRREQRFRFLRGEASEAVRQARREGAVLVSEPLARKAALGVGDRIALPGPTGERAFPVAGIYRDYSSESGVVVMDLATMEGWAGPGEIGSLALYLRPGHEPEHAIDRLRGRLPDAPLLIRSNRRLREEVMAVFDQTFQVTRILQAMALLIAAAGITLTLLVLARERVRELALCRALGATRPQLGLVFLWQGLALALVALLLGLGGGAAIAAILVGVINPAYFGWTIEVHWPFASILREVGTILVAAGLASAYPALVASRTPATDLSRDDL